MEKIFPDSNSIKGDKFVGDYYVMFEKEQKKQVKKLVDGGFDKDIVENNTPIMKEAIDLLQKWENKDKSTIELWKKMNNWVYDGFDKTYDTLGVSFDKNYYESDTYLLGKKILRREYLRIYFIERKMVQCGLTYRKKA